MMVYSDKTANLLRCRLIPFRYRLGSISLQVYDIRYVPLRNKQNNPYFALIQLWYIFTARKHQNDIAAHDLAEFSH